MLPALLIGGERIFAKKSTIKEVGNIVADSDADTLSEHAFSSPERLPA